MTQPSTTGSGEGASVTRVAGGIWARLREHKVAQWTLAYAATAYTLLHVTEMLSEAQEWPHVIVRLISLLLILGVPIVITLAWYHGAKGLRRIGAGELVIITLLGIIAGSVLWYLQRNTHDERVAAHVTPNVTPATLTRPEPPAVNTTIPRTSIAVMPFANMTGDASKEYLGDGMAEEVINTLSQVQGLKVPARTSSFAYKGRNTDVRQIARDLGVGTILEGSVRAAGKRIRITAQLINAQDGLHLWSQTYDEEFTDLFKLQDDLAKAIVEALRMNLAADLPAVQDSSPTQNLEAYQLYLQAGSVGISQTAEALRESLRLYQEALARDAKFARAWSGSADVRARSLVFGYAPPNTTTLVEREARQALLLDPHLAEPHSALAFIYEMHGDWLKADAESRAAIAADARDPRAVGGEGSMLESLGHLRRTLAAREQAFRLAPASPAYAGLLATVHTIMGNDLEALKYAKLAVDLGWSPEVIPVPQVYMNAAVRSGRYAEAADRAVKLLPAAVREADGADVVRLQYAALADPAKRPSAIEATRQLVRRIQPEAFGPLAKDVIVMFVTLGAIDDAFAFANRWLDELARAGSIGIAWGALWLPEMRPFRHDMRFQAFAKRLGLIAYWKQYGPPDGCELEREQVICH